MKQTQFKLSLLTLSLCGASAISAYAYQQGEGSVATVAKGEIVTKVDQVTSDNPKQVVSGDLNRSGNPVRIIWYGNPKDSDGKVAQTGALNQGLVQGKVIAQGQRSGGGKNEKWAEVNVEGQANGIDALGWSAPTNRHDIDITIKSISNERTAIGEAELLGGLSTVHGRVDSLGTGNGISLTGTADFGKASGIDGFSGATGKASSSSISQDDTAGPSLADLEQEPPASINHRPADTSEADLHGKHVKVNLERVNNSGEVVGSIHSQASQGVKTPYTASYAPQFYGVGSASSGNGVSVATLIDTPDKYTYSEEKLNNAKLGTVENSGIIQGKGQLEGGQKVTHTQTKSRGSANGLSAHAVTGRFAKNTTLSQVLEVQNSGQISGELRQISGNNSAYKSAHLLSSAEAYGSGNGVSAFTESFNAQTKQAEAKVGNITNSGRIEGSAYLRAGNGTGDMTITTTSVGNGIAVFSERGNVSTGNIENSGIISGNIETRPGISAWAANRDQTIPEEAVKVYVVAKANLRKDVNTIPAKPEQARTLTYNELLIKDRAESTIYASGNGISTFQRNHQTAYMGDVYNKGVISGYANLYHGFASGEYSKVSFLGAGSGIFLSNSAKKLNNGNTADAKITNLGLISGNHAALLAKGNINTAYSIFNPTIESAYANQSVENYGLMAGTMIAGNYSPDISPALGSSGPTYRYFEAENDPIKNAGTYVYLKQGIKPPEGYFGSTERLKDAGEIDRVVVGSTMSAYTDPKTSKTYNIINGNVSSDTKDSDYTTTSNITNTIINGVGVAKGALYTAATLALDNVIVNGYKTALHLQDNANVSANNTTLNANSFNVNHSKPNAVLGTDGMNTLLLSGNSQINGDIDLKAGDDVLTVRDHSVQINSKMLDLGAGSNTLNLGDSNNANTTETNPIKVAYAIHNATTLNVNAPSKIASNAKITGTDTLNLSKNLVYQADNETRHALYDANRSNDLQIKGDGHFILDVANVEQKISFGGFKLTGKENFKTTNALQKVVKTDDGKLSILDIKAEEERERLAKALEEKRKAEEQARLELEKAKQVEEEAKRQAELAKKQAEQEAIKAKEQAFIALQEKVQQAEQSIKSLETALANIQQQQATHTAQDQAKHQALAQELAEAKKALENALQQSHQTQEKANLAEQKVKELESVLANITAALNDTVADKQFNDKIDLLDGTNSATTFLVNSASLKNKGEALETSAGLQKAEQLARDAIINYVEQAKNHNIYGALTNNALETMRDFRFETLNHIPALKEQEFAAQANVNNQSRHYNQVAKNSDGKMLTLGMAYGVNDGLTIGANVGITKQKITGDGANQLKGQSISSSLYAKTEKDRFNFVAGLAYQHTDFDGNRSIDNGYDKQRFNAKADTDLISAFAQAKYVFPLTSQLGFEPKVGIAYNHFVMNAIQENGAGALYYDRQHSQNAELSLGQDLAHHLATTNGEVVTKLSLDYIYNTKPKAITAHFANGKTFELYNEHNQNLLRTGIASQYKSKSGISFGVGVYSEVFRKSGSTLQVHTHLGYTF